MTETVLHPAPPAPRRTVRINAGAIATPIACVLPVFLLGGLAVQMGDDLHFTPAGLGLAVSVYFGVSALASVPSGGLVERYGPAVVARAAARLTLLSSGLDPRGLVGVDVGHLERQPEYVGAARAFATGTPDGIRSWLRHYTAAVEVAAAGLVEIGDEVLAGV